MKDKDADKDAQSNCPDAAGPLCFRKSSPKA